MAPGPVEPTSTLAILLGASKFPESPGLKQGRLFAASAEDFARYLTGATGFNIPHANLLNLFDAHQHPNEIDARVGEFLRERQKQLKAAETPARDLIVYYVGHGGFTPGDQKYFLATWTTREGYEGSSSIRMSDFAETVRKDARDLRRYLILDCCFAAKAFIEFQATGLAAATRAKTIDDEFAGKGTAMLCAASARDLAIAPMGRRHTMFSGALLDVLERGISDGDSRLSLEEVGSRVATVIRDQFADEAVRPEVSSPDQREGKVASVPLFPNPGLGLPQLRERLDRLESALDAAQQKLMEVSTSIRLLVSAREPSMTSISNPEPDQAPRDETEVPRLKPADQQWLRAGLPPDIQVELRTYRQSLTVGYIWMVLGAIVCIVSLLTDFALPGPLLFYDPVYWLARHPLILPALAGSIYAAAILAWKRARPKSNSAPAPLSSTNSKVRSWDWLPEVVAMRSAETYPAFGSIRIAGPWFEIGAAIFWATTLIDILSGAFRF